MTAATLAHLPLQVGGVALAQAGRVALWVVQRYMRAPLTNSAIAALVVTSAMAGSNALFGQRHEHPAPLFAPVENVTTGSIDSELVIPKTRPKTFTVSAPAKIAAVDDAPAPASTGEPVGNKDVFEIQRKLEQMQLFSGTVDGYYGPRTAQAIRKFEEQSGLKPTGELTRETIGLILAAPLAATRPAQPVAPIVAPKAVPEADALPAVTLPKAEAAPVEQELMPARAQQPLAANVKPLVPDAATSLKAAARTTTAKLLGRPVPATPGQALEMAADTAGDAINTIIDGVQSVAMNAPPRQPFAAEDRVASTAEPAAPVALVPNSVSARAQQVAALPDNPQVGVPLKIEEEAPKPGESIAVLDTDATPDQVKPVSVTDPVVVAKVQRGLASLGFLHGPADGVAGEATAKAIRNFEVYFNYKVTGQITPELLDLLVDSGAVI
ncbi:MAG: peptidoglycan-binding protein [Devosia sp.]|uniref:peptidoglycan-binding protein n=1 Tax=Devosia sp. TaxID=1871048 RepID=UPI001AD0CCF7|nr:peptidoglycan-binding protein [Devosia sp.]MBN9317339.1 peptidoglycan-binding protein [Devosia sp.]